MSEFKPNHKWIAFHFTDEEDLFLVSNRGELYIFDPKTGAIRDK